MPFSGRWSSSEYCACSDATRTPPSRIAWKCGVSKFVVPMRSILPSSCSSFSQAAVWTTPSHLVAPPVQLDEVEPILSKALQRALDDGSHLGPRWRKPRRVGHDLGVDLDQRHRLRAEASPIVFPESADHLLHAGIDVGAVERRDAGLRKGRHVPDRPVSVDRPVVAGKLPAALDQAGNAIALCQLEALDRGRAHRSSSLPGRATAVVSPWRNQRFRIRVIR